MKGAILNLIMGLWLLVSPAILNYGKPMASNNYIIGPLVTSFAIIAFSECTRSVNKWNLLNGLWLIIAPLVLSYQQSTPIVNLMLSGILIIVFSLFKKNVEKSFGGGWLSLWEN